MLNSSFILAQLINICLPRIERSLTSGNEGQNQPLEYANKA